MKSFKMNITNADSIITYVIPVSGIFCILMYNNLQLSFKFLCRIAFLLFPSILSRNILAQVCELYEQLEQNDNTFQTKIAKSIISGKGAIIESTKIITTQLRTPPRWYHVLMNTRLHLRHTPDTSCRVTIKNIGKNHFCQRCLKSNHI